MKGFIGLAVVLIAAMAAGCRMGPVGVWYREVPTADYDRALPPGRLALRKITDPNEIPDFTPGCMNLAGLREAIAGSLDYLGKPSSRAYFPYGEITHDQAVKSLQAFAALLHGDGRSNPASKPSGKPAIGSAGKGRVSTAASDKQRPRSKPASSRTRSPRSRSSRSSRTWVRARSTSRRARCRWMKAHVPIRRSKAWASCAPCSRIRAA